MSNHDNGIAERVNLLEFLHDDMAVAAIEVTSRLVCKNDARASNEAACDSDALLLTAR